ncbi:tripartite tricarboxylate transporter substrate binding protein [Verminephrobacter aporrectodeae subsp. tuberculatae]|uniref:tripartite tricarboxylate transporter substrate binding protein n=1 Tax=Verminephrobacter aporrectodeae TaxID=1110389 RepID=UPI0022389324|nr:tripartite tricarboxylate transporter substrate binding protein [Verminephrobacter aporrectodeae]MCW5257618.1 tripartite tricarboxylate transporter substrate binding protein [Verminephrobacter aporrectodeae subsp. tuberculatae]MCW8200437.1 tripartite tricarboxylate transporter substrate binding protein [Verminephrobacter aporrectodeae subsp. tuberculatae]
MWHAFARDATRCAHRCLVLLACASALAAGPAWAWPEKPIELVVGFAAGGGTDTTARTLAQHLSRQLGAQVVVSNRAGASGELALAYVARSAPDGHVLGMANMPGLVTLPIERRTPFQANDFSYLANLVRDPSAFSVVQDSKYQSLADLIADAKARPGEISYGSTGVGTDDHLGMVLFERLSGTRLNHVPFNGAGPLRNAVLGGHVTLGGMNLGEAMPFRHRLRILAQAGAGRSRLAPQVPSFSESGLALVLGSERGVVAPRGLPQDVEKRLIEALRAIAADPQFRRQMEAQFTEMDYLEGADWRQRLDRAAREFADLWRVAPWGEARPAP